MEYISSNTTFLTINTTTITVMIALLLFSAFFSMCETVYSSVKITKLESMKKDKVRGAKLALKIANNFDHTLTTLLVGNNIVNIGLATLAVSVFKEAITAPELVNWVELISTISMTIIILIFGEILPKTYAKAHAERTAILIAPLVNFVHVLLWPISVPFVGLKNTIIKKNDNEITVTESEFDTIIGTMSTEGVIADDEKEMLQSVLNLNDMHVSDIMTPRVEMHAIDIEDSIEEITKIFFDLQFSRIPVYQDTPDNIIGILYERELFTAIIKGNPFTIEQLLREPLFVPHSMKVDTLIEIIQQEKQHMAVVVDEYGGTNGIVTMEDALEVLVGEIYDEYDTSENKYILEVKENKYHVNAAIGLDDFFEELKLSSCTPESNSTSLAGFLMELNDTMPLEGDDIYYMVDISEKQEALRLHFKVKKVTHRRIRYVTVELEDPSKDKEIEKKEKKLFKSLDNFRRNKLKKTLRESIDKE